MTFSCSILRHNAYDNEMDVGYVVNLIKTRFKHGMNVDKGAGTGFFHCLTLVGACGTLRP